MAEVRRRDLWQQLGQAAKPAVHVFRPPVHPARKAGHQHCRCARPLAGWVDSEQSGRGHLGEVLDEAKDPGFSLGDVGLFLVELFAHVAAQHRLAALAVGSLDNVEEVDGRGHSAAKRPR